MPISPAFQRLGQEDGVLETRLDYSVRPCWKERREGGKGERARKQEQLYREKQTFNLKSRSR